MRGTISKIHPLKYSRNGGAFVRIEFKLNDGQWAKTDIVTGFRNYERWKNILTVGIDLEGLDLKSKNEVNADSYPEIFREVIPGKYIQMEDGSMKYVPDIIPKEIKPLEKLEPEPKQYKLI